MANLPQMKITKMTVERLAKSASNPHGWPGVLTFEAQNDEFFALGHARKSAIFANIRLHADGSGNAEANLPLQAQHRFLLGDQYQFDWAKSQADAFSQSVGAWNYAHFLKAVSDKKIAQHSCGSKPSSQIIKLSGEVVWEFFLHGTPPRNGVGRQICLWNSDAGLVDIYHVENVNDVAQIVRQYEGDIGQLRQVALKFMGEKYAPPVVHAYIPPTSTKKKPEKGLLVPRKTSDLAGGMRAEPIKPREMTLFETVMRYADAHHGK